MSLKKLILKILYSSHVALTVHELCCRVNNKTPDYCQNVDGRGGHCVWWYRRGDGFTNRYHLVEPDCRYNALYLFKVLSSLLREGKVKKYKTKMHDPYSPSGYDYYTLLYVREEQLQNRLRRGNKTILDYLTA